MRPAAKQVSTDLFARTFVGTTARQVSTDLFARAFVGTYGGYAYLAPFCNVPAIAFYANRDGFHHYHLELADRVFRRMNTASLVALDVRDAALLRTALSSAQNLHA